MSINQFVLCNLISSITVELVKF